MPKKITVLTPDKDGRIRLSVALSLNDARRLMEMNDALLMQKKNSSFSRLIRVAIRDLYLLGFWRHGIEGAKSNQPGSAGVMSDNQVLKAPPGPERDNQAVEKAKKRKKGA